MSEVKLRFRVHVGSAMFRAGFLGLVFLAGAGKLCSEDVILTAYYPPPSGVYRKIVAMETVQLATVGGSKGVVVGHPTAPPQANIRLDIQGDMKVSDVVDVTSTTVSRAAGCTLNTSPDGNSSCGGGQYRTLLPGVYSVWSDGLVDTGTRYYCCTCPTGMTCP